MKTAGVDLEALLRSLKTSSASATGPRSTSTRRSKPGMPLFPPGSAAAGWRLSRGRLMARRSDPAAQGSRETLTGRVVEGEPLTSEAVPW